MAKRAEAEAIEETEVSRETIADRARSYLSEVQALAAEYIDASEEFANRLLDLQSRSTNWAKETVLARVFEAQNSLGRRLVEVSARTARALWRVGAEVGGAALRLPQSLARGKPKNETRVFYREPDRLA